MEKLAPPPMLELPPHVRALPPHLRPTVDIPHATFALPGSMADVNAKSKHAAVGADLTTTTEGKASGFSATRRRCGRLQVSPAAVRMIHHHLGLPRRK
jgi:hypothetical protein